MAPQLLHPFRALLNELWPLVAFGVGLIGFLHSVNAIGELLSILDWTGAIGGDQSS